MATKELSAVAGQGAITAGVATLTDAATISVDASLGDHFRVTIAGNRTMANPANPTDAQKIMFEITQDATGSRTITWGTAFKFGSNGAPVLSTAAAKADLVGFCYNAPLGVWRFTGSQGGF